MWPKVCHSSFKERNLTLEQLSDPDREGSDRATIQSKSSQVNYDDVKFSAELAALWLSNY